MSQLVVGHEEGSKREQFVITREGYILLTFTMILAIFGLYLFNPIMFIPGFSFQIGFIYVITRFVLRKQASFKIHITFPSTIIKAKQYLTLHCKVENAHNIIGHLTIHGSSGLFPVLKPNHTIMNSANATGTTFIFYAPRRGKERIFRATFEYGGIMGLFYVQHEIILNQEIVVLPQPQRIQLPWTLKQKIFDEFISEISINKRGRGDEFLSLRDFQFGDELRHIHWKASARWNKLVTREFEEPIMLRFLIVVDRSMLMAGPKLEFALSSIVELCSVIRNSNHSCTILVHGDKSTWQYNLKTSPSSFSQLAIHLHNVEPEGNEFNFRSLRDYIIHHRLVDTVMILISDMEKDVTRVIDGYAGLKPYIQRLIYFACFTPGFGTLAFEPFAAGDIIEPPQYYYRMHILEPKVNLTYRMLEKKYTRALNRPFSRFQLIETYNTNILLELRSSLAKLRGSKQIKREVPT